MHNGKSRKDDTIAMFFFCYTEFVTCTFIAFVSRSQYYVTIVLTKNINNVGGDLKCVLLDRCVC